MAITVSIVEDNDQLRGTLARVINRAEGFRCLSQYPDAESAVEALPRDRPDVVLMDINLPGMNGVECARRLTRCPGPPGQHEATQRSERLSSVHEEGCDVWRGRSSRATIPPY